MSNGIINYDLKMIQQL